VEEKNRKERKHNLIEKEKEHTNTKGTILRPKEKIHNKKMQKKWKITHIMERKG